MKAKEFRKKWMKQFEDKPQPFDSFSESAIAFAEDYHKNRIEDISNEAKKVLMTDNGQMAKEFIKSKLL